MLRSLCSQMIGGLSRGVSPYKSCKLTKDFETLHLFELFDDRDEMFQLVIV